MTLKALKAGKHVYVEKPLATDLVDAAEVMAALKPVWASCWLRAGYFSRKRSPNGPGRDRPAGLIGEPIGVSGFVTHSRAELWHPDPTFLFERGGGPLLDLGPYWITAMINCLGPIGEVEGMTRIGASTPACPDAGSASSSSSRSR